MRIFFRYQGQQPEADKGVVLQDFNHILHLEGERIFDCFYNGAAYDKLKQKYDPYDFAPLFVW
ncbi:hypothetical protein Nhal_3165 [Nitrosococcus halophilus Nc 4]|uniref:Uncharacterized protein n=1 Tax=Nitrosococcus halophilus (strain Nc4) TaxID=472759 RepID=D5BZX0_NITHN|nr:hypothetical protein Nhal_3165 [Nitrosococcus halophilus Nc 4]